MSETTTPDVPDDTPDILSGVRNRNGDSWYEYDGEPMWDAELIEAIHDRLTEASEKEWDRVASSPKAAMLGNGPDVRTSAKIRTEDADEFEERLEERVEEVADEIGGWLVQLPAPDIHEKGPRRTDVRINYSRGHRVSMGGESYKKGKVVKKLRDYEMHLYHTRVIDPLFEEFNEKYPY